MNELDRKLLGALVIYNKIKVVIDVHNRDIVNNLIKENIQNI